MKQYFYKLVEKRENNWIVADDKIFVSQAILDSFEFDRPESFVLEVRDVILTLSHYLTQNDHSYAKRKYELKELAQIKTLLTELYKWEYTDKISVW